MHPRLFSSVSVLFFAIAASFACAGSAPEPATWWTTEVDFMDRVGQSITVDCPPKGRAGTVHGTGTYGAASSICTAAVHAGKITLASGGRVTFHMKGKFDDFVGSSRNGITSSAYPSYNYSFTF